MVNNMDIFSKKELEAIALFEPPTSAEEIITKVLRDWFSMNIERLHIQVKKETEEQKVDDVVSQLTEIKEI